MTKDQDQSKFFEIKLLLKKKPKKLGGKIENVITVTLERLLYFDLLIKRSRYSRSYETIK